MAENQGDVVTPVASQHGLMEMTHRRLNRVDVLALRGRMMPVEAAALQAQIDQLIKQGRTSLVLDLAELEYISSGGIRVLMDARKRAQAAKPRGDLRLAGAGERIKAVLALTGLTTYFQSYDDLAEAVGSF